MTSVGGLEDDLGQALNEADILLLQNSGIPLPRRTMTPHNIPEKKKNITFERKEEKHKHRTDPKHKTKKPTALSVPIDLLDSSKSMDYDKKRKKKNNQIDNIFQSLVPNSKKAKR